MLNKRTIPLQEAYLNFIGSKDFPCIGARVALAKDQVECMVARSMACPADDEAILSFLYDFTDRYRCSTDHFHSAVIIFEGPGRINEEIFETLLWQRLQAISDMDAARFGYDRRVSADPSSPDFSFSLKEEAFFVIGMHPGSSRAARRFDHPALVFNPHAQFEEMKKTAKYEKIKQAVRKRDIAFSGSINPMLTDHGKSSETLQYSGKNYTEPLRCPLKINHATN
jgi:FPC/CPF motif-containing protein YcgG